MDNYTSRMSLPERMFEHEGFLLLREEYGEGVNLDALMYEWVTFNLPGEKYTPDFMAIFSNGKTCFIEVKQEAITKKGKRYFAGKSYRDSRSKLRAAASLNPWWDFYMAVYNNGGWRLEKIAQEAWVYPSVLNKEAP